MAITANTRIKLGANKPKKDAVVDAPGTAPADDSNEIAISIGTAVDPLKTQSIIGDFEKLYRYAKTNLESLVPTGLAGTYAVVHIPAGGSDAAIVNDGTPGTGDLTLEVGALVYGEDQSHFLHRTFKRLCERWLEESK
jgi:hypothetical protein